MAPYVHAFIVEHEKAFEYFLRSIKVNSVPMGDVFIIFHVAWGSVIVPDRSFGWRFNGDFCILFLFLLILLGFRFFWGDHF